MMAPFKYGNELSSRKNDNEFLDKLRDYQLLKKDGGSSFHDVKSGL
jgi:hypothetical protein